jgi:uncharacterized protein YcfJ
LAGTTSAATYPKLRRAPEDRPGSRRYRDVVDSMRGTTMKRVAIGSLFGVAALATLPASAQPWHADAESYTAQARVLRAVPVREAVNGPQQECWTESTGGASGNQAAGALIGGIAGGLIGHQIGSGSGNTAATIAGTIGGAAVGNEVARRNSGERVVERCRTVGGYDERVVGYDVTYRFQGREFNTRLPYDPGPDMPVNVTVAPAR